MTAPTADCGKLTLAAVVKRCTDGLRTKHDDLQSRVSVFETAEYGLQVKELRDEISRRRRTDTADGIEEIEEKALKLKRRRVEI